MVTEILNRSSLCSIIILLCIVVTGCTTQAEPSALFSIKQDETPVIETPSLDSDASKTDISILVSYYENPVEKLYQLNLYSHEFQQILEVDRSLHSGIYYPSSDGKYLIVREDGKLRVIELESGTELIVIDSGPLPTTEFTTVEVDNGVSWSPSNTKFAFLVESQNLSTDIKLYDLTTKTLINLTNSPSRENGLTWSSDGENLAFSVWDSCGNSLETCTSAEQFWNIASINIDNLNQNYLTNAPNTLLPSGDWLSTSLCQLQWSPNQSYVVFKSHCPATTIPSYDEIFVTAYTGAETTKLTNYENIDYANYYSTAWTYDSQYLIVAYKHDFLFDETIDESGFLVFKAGAFSEPINKMVVENLSVSDISWSPQTNYLIAAIDDNKMLLGQIEDEQIRILASDLPNISLNGCWTEDGYVSQEGNHMIKVTLPEGLIMDLGVELQEGMKIIGCLSN